MSYTDHPPDHQNYQHTQHYNRCIVEINCIDRQGGGQHETAIIYIVMPIFTSVNNAAVLNSDVYNVVISASTLVWAISATFLFINLARFYFSHREEMLTKLIFPLSVLWISVVLGTLTCLVSIVGTLVYSLIPQQIGNNQWWWIVGGITMMCLAVAAIGSMFANSEAQWQKMS